MRSSAPLALYNASYIDDKPSGIGVVARDLAFSLDPELVQVLDPVGCFPDRGIQIPNNLSPKYGTKGHLRRLLWTQNRIPELIKQSKAEFLISPLPEAPLLRNINSIILVHDLLPLRYPQFTPLLSYHLIYVPLVVHNSVKVLCNSEATAKELNSRLKVPMRKIRIIPLGFDSNKLYPLKLKRKPFFLVLGRHDPHKNIANILIALSLLSLKDVELWFVGSHDKRYTPSLKRLASELGLEKRCKWIPWVSDHERLTLLNSCQSLIIGSLWEGFGLPAIEAMACEAPVIASCMGALPEVVGDAGLLIEPLNPASISDAMKNILSDQSLCNSLAERGKERIKKYTWDKAAAIVEKTLKEI